MKPINPNSIAYFMGFNASRLNRPDNPFRFPTIPARDWLHGYVAAHNLKRAG
jgi:hypothetical protein